MTTTSTIQQAVTGAASAASSAASAGAGKKSNSVEDAQQRFLQLLITQIQNQDPLNPLDNAQVTTQLAQLNTVSGIERLNSTLEALASSLAASQSMQATAMIGRGVLVSGTGLALAGGQAIFGVELPQSVDSLTVTIRDATGRAIHNIDLGPQKSGIAVLHWDGAADDGTRVADGAYRFSVKATAGGKPAEAAPLAYGRVGGVAREGAGIELSIDGIGSATLADVKQII